ncbi:ABC transporter ATP-binding protein [Erythrobacter litoralis]|uniref:ABC transporter ATP-binding protein n=1 Tax=Erythrobacter litoralis TaxID=39960 RepID=UPI002435FF14|nr:ABC transporter ATP-binding protein [Erythrobacter litoralis]MDG6078438.1 ABC transporter ATP-binding protein [Erythrobacter litoralis]
MTLEAKGLTLGTRLDGVSAKLTPGSITAICGPNGAGKSSLLECLAGLLSPTSGTAALDGQDVLDLTPRHRAHRIGYLPQQPEIAWDVPVRNLIELGRFPHGDRKQEPVDAAIRALDLNAFQTRRAQSLSGGETARVLLARVLAGEPDWILADEPLAALDLSHQLILIGHLRRVANAGAGVVIVLHDLAMARNHADHVLLLDRGRIAQNGPPEAALSEEAIGAVFGVSCEWIGEPGRWALSTFPN